MKKILFVSNRTSFSGGEVVLLRLIERDKAIEPVVVTPRGEFSARLKDLEIKTHLLNEISQLDRSKNSLWPIHAVRNLFLSQSALIRIIKKENPDLIHANALGAAVYSFIPSLLSRKHFIWTSHNIYYPGSLNTLAVRLVGVFSDRVIAVSQAVQRNLISSGIPDSKAALIYNGLDVPHPAKKSGEIQRKFHLPPHTRAIGLIGTITPWKGQETLVDAAAQIVRDHPKTAFFLIGDVEDPDYEEKLQKKIRVLGLSDSIFLTGFLHNISGIYRDLDIVVNASVEPEPFGTTIYEAMARGILVIGSDIGGTPEIIDDSKTGFLFKAGDSSDLADKISYIMSHSDKLEPVKENARRSVAEHFDISTMVKKYNDLYESL